MAISSHRKSIALFITIGAILVAVAVTLNIGLIVWNWRTGVMYVLGALFCGLIIAGVVLNTIFLVREIRRNEQHDHFINAVTHELKTPVASIRLYLETLQTREMNDQKRQQFYGVMLADTDRLTRTIDQVLRAGQAKTWRKHQDLHVLDFGALVTECVSLARMRHHLSDTAIECKSVEALVRGDADELQAAVTNLLDNAIKYSKPEVRVTVEVAAVDAKSVAVRVHDEGVGISGEELKRIFGRFYRIPGLVSTRVKGTGLGLFIVRTAAKRHGGKAYAESLGPGHGSTFTLQLPRAGGSVSSILLVEDEQHLAFGLSFNLEADGYQVEIVETGEAALEVLRDPAKHFDLVVLDVMLPGMDGFAVVGQLRAQSQFIPVLMLTARGRAEDVLQGFAAGADDYLPKPFELSILIARIKGLLRRRDWMRAPARDRFEFQGKVIDFETMLLHVGDKELPLTLMEANLFRYLIQREGKTISRKSILEDVWGVHEDTDTRAIDNFVVRLRRYIEEDPGVPKHLLTVRGVGYRFIAEPDA